MTAVTLSPAPLPDAPLLPVILCFLNASFIYGALLLLPTLRRHPVGRIGALAYGTVSIGVFLLVFAVSNPHGPDLERQSALALTAIASYLPLFGYLAFTTIEALLSVVTARLRPDGDAFQLLSWLQRPLRAARGGGQRVLRKRQAELLRRPDDPELHRELRELLLALGRDDEALYHAYTLIELLPHSTEHALAIFRLAQLLVDRKEDLEAAQPHLKRLARLYPRTYFAGYARRLINQYEAYAEDRR